MGLAERESERAIVFGSAERSFSEVEYSPDLFGDDPADLVASPEIEPHTEIHPEDFPDDFGDFDSP